MRPFEKTNIQENPGVRSLPWSGVELAATSTGFLLTHKHDVDATGSLISSCPMAD